MNKIAQYLNEHILGEATDNEHIRQRYSRDGSILSINPGIVIRPRCTNDVRKVMRFAWQLAEKGHILPIIPRGEGSNQTGSAIGKGLIIESVSYLDRILYINIKPKDQFAHVQPGVNFNTLNEVIKNNGLAVNLFNPNFKNFSIGGAISENLLSIGESVNRLEIVLANGDLIETSRISKHELNKKKGLQTFEGEIYRKIDGIIEDNEQTINDKIANDSVDNAGYPGISKVKNRDGSFDLTPLIIGSQGTLGYISEAVLKLEFSSDSERAIVAVFENPEIARDVADKLISLQPNSLEIIDGEIFKQAKNSGKNYCFKDEIVNSLLFISFNDFNDRVQKRKFKNAIKKLGKLETVLYTSENYSLTELYIIRDVGNFIIQTTNKTTSVAPIINGSSIPLTRREEFITALKDLAKKHHLEIPMRINWLNGIVYNYPEMQLNQVSDRQKTFKLIEDYIGLVIQHGGNIVSDSSEGRLKTNAAYKQMDDDVLKMYQDIRQAFDPYGILNPGVKQNNDLKTLVGALNPNYNLDYNTKYPIEN